MNFMQYRTPAEKLLDERFDEHLEHIIPDHPECPHCVQEQEELDDNGSTASKT